MRILKKKIARARQITHEREASVDLLLKEVPETMRKENKTTDQVPKSKTRVRNVGSFTSTERDRATKNIVKNYGKAICSFACSELSRLYLERLLEGKAISICEFMDFAEKAKESIDSIQSFRSLLLIKEGDSDKIAKLKRTFGSIGEIFIKYFSVNWIFSGRIIHRESHLKFRFKMLRRIQKPELFTYLKQHKNTSAPPFYQGL